MRPPILSLVIGLTLCGAGAAMLYAHYANKKDEKTTDDTDNKAAVPKKQPSPEETKVEIKLTNQVIPLVVGRGGANLKSIENKSGAVIRFRELDDSHQICEIRGLAQCVNEALKLVKAEASRSLIVVEEVVVPQSACGKIKGRCGDALQEICRKSGAKVAVLPADRGDGSTRRMTITGTRVQVNFAKGHIRQVMLEQEEQQKRLDATEAQRTPRGNVRTPTSSPGESLQNDLAKVSPLSYSKEKLVSQLGDGQAYVSAVASPARFWLQLVGPQSVELDQLVGTMTEYYNDPANQRLHKITQPRLGQIVAAMFKYDGKWYRAEVVSILPNEFKSGEQVYDLYFVDYGDSEYVSPHELFELRTDFLTLRFQAIECYLAKVQPKIQDQPDIWQNDAISRFEELTHVAQWKKMTYRYVNSKERKKGDPIRREGSPVPGVELYEVAGDEDTNIGQTLIREGYAVPDYEDVQRSRSVLRLDGGYYGVNGSHLPDEDKLIAAVENSTNENIDNVKKDTQTNGFSGAGNGNTINSDYDDLRNQNWSQMVEEDMAL